MNFTYVDNEGNSIVIDSNLKENIEKRLSYYQLEQERFRKHEPRASCLSRVSVFLMGLILILFAINTTSTVDDTMNSESFTSNQVKVIMEAEPAEIASAEESLPIDTVSTSTYFKPEALPQELFEVVVVECELLNVPVNAALAIMKTETQGFSVNSVNHNNNGTQDCGVMQINSSNISGFASRYNCPEFATNPYDPVANITVGVRHFGELYNSYYETYQNEVKSLLAAAGAYNRGAGNQNKYKNIYEYNARVYAHYINLCEGKDVNINYAAEIPEIKRWLINNIQL